MFLYIKNFLNSKWHKQLFQYILYISYILMIISLTSIGIGAVASKYLHIIHKYIIYYISLILIGRFNPYIYDNIFDKYDREIIFSAGIALLLTTGSVHFLENFI